LSALLGTKVVSLCSIGNPDSFERTLLDQGAVIVHTRRFPDHHLYSDQDLREIGRSAVEEGADFIVTTEKDAVRLPENVELDVPLIVLLVELEFVHESTIPPQ
jgi:3-deoxy-D-manno-octulosonic-acid transferase